jgi:hypothetical protein
MKQLMVGLLFAVLETSAFAYYMPGQGRWLSRDPIEERGGRNLYALANNDAQNYVDRNGLDVAGAGQGADKDQGQGKDPYDGYDKEKDVTTYNCAGIAFRNYRYMSPEDTKAELAKGESIDCSKDCPPCQLKFWFWEYSTATYNSSTKQTGPWKPSFHVVGAPNSCEDGKELQNCYCKNGGLPVFGPVWASEQKPAEKEEIYKFPDGGSLFQVRKDFKASCYCKAKSAPPPPTTPSASPPATK